MTAEALDEAVAEHLAKGWRVESDTPTRVILVKGESKASRQARQKKPNHVLHLLLCIPTLGLWLIPWFIISMNSSASRRAGSLLARGEQRKVLSLREGEVVEV